MPRKTFDLALQSWTEIAPEVRHFTFAHAEGEELKFRAGQFFTLHLEKDGEEVLRSYSVAAPCVEDSNVEFSVSFVEGGIGTGTLFGLSEGDKLRVSGPHGRFILRNEEVDHYILVATGTGIAPFRAMVPQLLERVATGTKVSLVLGLGSKVMFLQILSTSQNSANSSILSDPAVSTSHVWISNVKTSAFSHRSHERGEENCVEMNKEFCYEECWEISLGWQASAWLMVFLMEISMGKKLLVLMTVRRAWAEQKESA